MKSAHEHVEAGQAALRTAKWSAARTCFEASLMLEDRPEAHDGLGVALWWLNEVEAAHQHRIVAFNEFKKIGRLGRAAGIAAWLAREQIFLNANSSAMKGWFARAERLLDEAGPCRERGWFIIFQASIVDGPPDLQRNVEQAIGIAREFQDSDLEAMCLAFGGMAAIGLGRLDEGLKQLDEAMIAATSGEVEDFSVASEIFCVMLSACELVGDLDRTSHWCQVAAEFAHQHNCPFLSAYCRTTYGGLLTASGRWKDAEVALLDAIRTFDAGHRALRVHAAIKLADLRAQQGKLEEAEILLAGHEDYGAAAVPRARLHLAKGEPLLARSVIDQALGPIDSASLDRAPLLIILIEVLRTLGDAEASLQVAEQLRELARKTGSDFLWAQAELAAGQVKQMAGDPGAANHFQSALTRLRSYEQSLLAGRVRLEMARVLQNDDWAGAVTWARGAFATFERMGATRDADGAAKLLRDLGVAGHPGSRLRGKLTQREEEVLALLARGLSNRAIADRLFISPKTAEHHVSQILEKLGVRSRAEAAAVAASGRPTNGIP